MLKGSDKPEDDELHELTRLDEAAEMEERREEESLLARTERSRGDDDLSEDERVDDHGHDDNHQANRDDDGQAKDKNISLDTLQRTTVRKLDWILLPFLALLFLLNSLDKSNIGNAESAGFSSDTGLSGHDINTALAVFFAFFVTLQPVGAALGRRFGMVPWIPVCMSVWGLCTILHIWVRRRWQLILLRVVIASLEAGFYPTTVSYLSLFYTRYEFAMRLGIFYGQAAVAGALGGFLSWAVFVQFHEDPQSNWRSWQVLFLVEGCLTIVVALVGLVWLPKSANSAWFFSPNESWWAEERIRRDQAGFTYEPSTDRSGRGRQGHQRDPSNVTDITDASYEYTDDQTGLLSRHRHPDRSTPQMAGRISTVPLKSFTADSGLTRHDVASAILNFKIWLILVCNILSAIPVTAFSVFLPMVMTQLSPSLNLSPAASNLLSAPPFAFGAVVLFLFTWWSDQSQRRIVPILASQVVTLAGLTASVLIPMSNYLLRYLSLCILLSGSYVSSPLTVAWLSNNTPEHGKRAILLGINGWGNLAGVFSALLFTPKDAENGYSRSFLVTLICMVSAFGGFVFFRSLILWENRRRKAITESWTGAQRMREEVYGDVPVVRKGVKSLISNIPGLRLDNIRRGDERLTFKYTT